MNGFTNRRYREGIIQFRKYKRRFEKLKGRLERKIAAGTFYRLPLGTRRYLIRRYHRLKTKLERLGVRLLQLGGIAALSLVFAASQAHAGAPNPLELSDLDGSYREGIIQFRKYKRRFEKLKGRLERKIAAGTFYRLPLGTRRYLIRRYHRLKTKLERLGVRLLQLGGIAALSLVFAASQAHAGAPNPLELSDLDGSNGFVINGIDPGDGSGGSGSSVGDVNGDGFDDLIIGAYGAAPGGRFGAGESYVIFGGNFTGVIETVTVLTINLNVNGQFEMQFIGVSGVEYVIEHSTDLVNWNTLTTVNGRANSELIVDVDASGEARRFYRVRSQNGE